jgi:CheY-like chemotaxis protein/HPt (histidine-containing phosphotransfer) domain-containing protein
LAITKQLVELQGGNITVKSREGEGTTFILNLPFQKSDAEIIQNTNEINFASSDVEGCKILVAEDNIMNQKYISSLLTKWNIDFTIALDGKKAVEQAQKQLFDVILMDIQMPNMDGYEATITIRNTKNLNQATPIIALTASAMLDQKNKALSTGMNDFITKPFAPNNLLNVIQRYLKNTNMSIEPPAAEAEKTNSSSFLDHDRLNDLYGDDKEYAADMIQTFFDEVLPDFTIIDELFIQNDLDAVAQYLHKVKPTLGMVGLTDLEEQINEFETKVKIETNADNLKPAWNDFQIQLKNALPMLQKELQKLTQT